MAPDMSADYAMYLAIPSMAIGCCFATMSHQATACCGKLRIVAMSVLRACPLTLEEAAERAMPFALVASKATARHPNLVAGATFAWSDGRVAEEDAQRRSRRA